MSIFFCCPAVCFVVISTFARAADVESCAAGDTVCKDATVRLAPSVRPSVSSSEILELVKQLPEADRWSLLPAILDILRTAPAASPDSELQTGAVDTDVMEASSIEALPWAMMTFLIACIKATLYFGHIIIRERKRYFTREACLQGTFIAYLQYRFGYWYAWTKGAPGIVLASLSITLLLSGGFLLSFLTGQPLSLTLWSAWCWLAAPDGGGAAESVQARIVGIVVSCGGMLIFALLMSVVSSGFEEALHSLREGMLPVIEGNHIVILGWSPMALHLLVELSLGAESRGGSVITILAPLPKPEVEEILQDSDLDFGSSTVIVRSGDSSKPECLARVAIESAARVVLLSDQSLSREDADAKTLNTLLTLHNHKWPREATCVVQCELIRNQRLFKSLCHGTAEVLTTGDFVGSLMVQSSSQKGIAGVINDVFRYEGDEFYIHEVDGVAGLSFFTVMMRLGLKGATAVGIFHEEVVQLLPPMNTIIEKDTKLVLLGEDRSVLPSNLDIPDACIERLEMLANRAGDRAAASKVRTRLAETVVILGWNESVGAVIDILDRTVGPSSKVVVYAPGDVDEREVFLDKAQARRNRYYQNVTVEQRLGHIGARFQLESLPLKQATRILLLAESSLPSANEADSQTIAAILQVRDILDDMHLRNVSDRAVIVPQVLNASTQDAIRCMGLHDFINSNYLGAQILSMVSESPQNNSVIAEILKEDGCQFYLRELEYYPAASDLQKIKGLQSEGSWCFSFEEVSYIVALSGEIAVGWTSEKADSFGQWEMNPKDRTRQRLLKPNSHIVILKKSCFV